ncbi:phosphoribosyltransferase [Streptomyces sp. WMMC1477]|uniref:phosphoribosyltransferase n=1 Tax=Streptomyces sp. WMMC1477 TaxID=3015155 RepID=UPI0022B70FCE|nr:phosphoribosyltransferase family protein [Streptomyces sp. WMMC1477]MCZ7432200.1 phosphoribosyltransferase family protein [Streptomyces sp. WMMC1477]
MRFRDRRHAGRELAARLVSWADDLRVTDAVVLALPRGGVPVAAEVAAALRAPLDVVVARKIGAPGHRELGVGAIAGEGAPLYDGETLAMLGLNPDGLAPVVARERVELRRREELYRRGRPALDIAGRTVIVVDDGLATGVTARAALQFLRALGPERLVLAVPVCAPQSAPVIEREADDLVCLHQPQSFRAVGQWYDDFAQVTDDEVIATLDRF